MNTTPAIAPPLHAVLHTSTLAAGVQPLAVAAMFRQSRELNPPLGITGALVFDGEHFAQLMIGPPLAVLRRVHDTAADPRQTGLRLLFEGQLDAAALAAARWLAGWAQPDALRQLHTLPSPAHGPVLQTFQQLLPSFDLM